MNKSKLLIFLIPLIVSASYASEDKPKDKTNTDGTVALEVVVSKTAPKVASKVLWVFTLTQFGSKAEAAYEEIEDKELRSTTENFKTVATKVYEGEKDDLEEIKMNAELIHDFYIKPKIIEAKDYYDQNLSEDADIMYEKVKKQVEEGFNEAKPVIEEAYEASKPKIRELYKGTKDYLSDMFK